MKVAYMINSDLGKHGPYGFRASKVITEAYNRGSLAYVISRGNFMKNVPKKYFHNIFPLLRYFDLGATFLHTKVTKKIFLKLYIQKAFDIYCSMFLKKADILHIYEPTMPRTVRKAKAMGMKVISDMQVCHDRAAAIMTGVKPYVAYENQCNACLSSDI